MMRDNSHPVFYALCRVMEPGEITPGSTPGASGQGHLDAAFPSLSQRGEIKGCLPSKDKNAIRKQLAGLPR